MRRLVFSILLCTVAVSVFAAQRDTLRILAIGNSFSADAVEDHLYPIALEKGVTLIIGNMYIPGCSLERHAGNVRDNKADYNYRKIAADGIMTKEGDWSLERAIADEDWDIVTLQQSSPISGQTDGYFPFINEMIDFIKANQPEAEIVFHMTWAYDPASPHKGFIKYGNDQELMYKSIMATVMNVTAKVGIDKVIPCATAMQNARTTLLEDKVNKSDGYHLSRPHGRYLAACVWVEYLLGKNVKGVKYCPEGMTPAECLLAQKSARASVRNPFKVTRIR